MNFKTKLSRVAIAVAVSAGLATSAIAQETSSALRGVVSTEAGQIVAGASITLTDTRTGSVRSFETNANGSFTVRGLRVGGPYTLSVVDSQGTRTIEDIFVNLGEAGSVNVELISASDLERITVTGSAIGVMSESVGPSSNFGFDDLQYQPSIDRDIKDVLQTDPRITIDVTNSNAIQCAGGNPRGNSLTVDGIQQNDNFGLNNNGFPTERLPFPFDAVDQVDVQLAPYDVTYGGFTGCNINAVIRSGENDVFGSVFYDYTNDSLQSDKVGDRDLEIPAFTEVRYGGTVGFPVIKNKLFVFAAYEKWEPSVIFDNGPEGAGFADPIAGLTVPILDEIRSISNSVYGYQPGEIATGADEEEEKVLIKVDWQINADHRAAFTYQNTDGNTISTTGASDNSYAFTDRYYERANELTTYALSVYSDWSSNFFTEVRVGIAEVKNGQTPFTSDSSFGDVVIRDAVDNVDVFLGADRFRQANVLEYDTNSFKFAGTYLTGDHEITGGIEYQEVDVFNLFVPGSQGIFEFDGIENFRNQQAFLIEYSIPGSLDPNDGAAAFTFENTTVYVQDRWLVNEDLTLTYGLRYDTWQSDVDPIANPNFQQRYGFTNGVGPDFDLLQPRLGFNYILDDATFIYGGVGLFAGGNPNVWLSNNFSNNGVSILNSEFDNEDGDVTDPEILAALNGANTPNFGLELPALSSDPRFLAGGDGTVNALDEDFEVPSLWKYSVGIQREFFDGYIAGAEWIYTSDNDNAKTVALHTVRVGTAADGRPIYRDADLLDADCVADPSSSACSGRRGQDYYLTNGEETGDSSIVTFTLQKQFDNGLRVNTGYTYSDINDGSPMNSSTASSNYGNLSVSDLAEPGIATSNYETTHRFTLNLSYTANWIEEYATRINLFAVRRSGRAYSYNFDGDPGFGDERGFEDRNLLYVPLASDPIVQYGPDFQLDEFNQFIADAGLEGARGSILPRNSQNSSWYTRVDLRVSQEIPGFSEDHRGEIFFTVRNLGNLLNSDWGTLEQVNFEYNNPVVDARLQDDGTYLFTNFDGDRGQSVNLNGSAWTARIGINYRF